MVGGTHHRTATVDGLDVFYREAGLPDAPPLVLLHGFPTSSHMFRELIPALADQYHVVAPDHIGFGYSSAPSLADFPYTFDALTDVTASLLDQLDIRRYAVYMQDYGAPIALRLLLRRPESISAIITQSGNAYQEGFVEAFWKPLFTYANEPGPKTEAAARQAFTEKMVRWQYETGVPDVSLVSPDAWRHAMEVLARPGNDENQLQLFRDYKTNLDIYPQAQECFRQTQLPLLAVWGANDEIFGPDGARAFARDLPDAEIHLLDTGHFALETHVDEIAGHIREFLGRLQLQPMMAVSKR
ncbi:pimeloyl-ACP methyl ester carboxylesterase [Micromonospora kangleipakensis]|uniref:Pimeloyl-ACP methyl ester carboxylesterase n=1 Tax=Micromonospora kangleipakensis TaxID=1077942 RepID=A0A4Q8BEJ1_9ACTN|nr:alpha/beta fold hydrolase [Micromonospora kangleipakensis]RZU76108.1 pimeloyl-ACP methyl ester carboxylesterase [Micromonospora kangleipakensis]